MPFDLNKAKQDNYTDEEIASHLASQSGFKLKEALKDGYSHREIVEYLSNKDMPSKEDFSTAISTVTHNLWSEPDIESAWSRQKTESSSVIDRAQTLKMLEKLPTETADEVRKRAIENMRIRKYGAIKQNYPSLMRAIGNIPTNVKEIVNSFASLIVGIPVVSIQIIKEVIDREREKQELTAQGNIPTPEEMANVYRPYYIEERLKDLGGALKDSYSRFKDNPLLTVGFFAEENPVDMLLMGAAGYDLLGLGVRGLGKAANIQSLMAKTRMPLKGGNIEVERQFSKNPLTRMFIQQPFDAAINRYPQLKEALAKYKGGKLTTDMRNTYEELNFTERARLHKEVYENIEKLSKVERDMAISFLEGRLHFRKDLPGDVQGIVDLSKKERSLLASKPVQQIGQEGKATPPEAIIEGKTAIPEGRKIVAPEEQISSFGGAPPKFSRGTESINYQRMKEFEVWYRGFQKKIENGFKLDKKMTTDQLEDVLYKPIEIETGLSREAIKKELGDFMPVYIHHYFPWKAKDKLGVHFAETTGKRYKPGMLKQRKGAEGYSEDLTEVLPRMASSYVKWKNSQAFLTEFLDTFGFPVNLRNVEAVKEGLKVGDQIYANHKIVAPDGYLRFYKGEIDIWKEITKRMDDLTDFDESLIDTLLNAKLQIGNIQKDFVGATKNVKVYLVPEEAYGKLETMATPVFGTQERQAIVKLGYDLPVRLWKDSVLSITPRWIKNNVMGDIIFNTFEGVGPLSYARGFTGKYKDVMPDRLLEVSFANLMKYNPKLGKAEETLIGQYVSALGETKPAKIASAIVDVGYGINTACEQPFVRALYVNIARKKAKELLKADGIPISQEAILTKMIEIKNTPELVKPLIGKVKETLPVFNTLGDFERKYARRAMPFFNWYKFMIGYGAKLPARHPFKLVGARGLAALTEKEREEAFRQYFPDMTDTIEKEGGIPRRFDGLWPIGKDADGEGIFFNAHGLNPFQTLSDIMDLRVVSMMSPVIKVGVERSLGIDTFTGRKFDTPYPIEITPDGEVEETEKTLPPLFSHIARQFPQFQLLEQSLIPAGQYSTGTVFNPKPKLDPITGEPKYPIDALDKMLNYMGIDRKTIDVEEWLYGHQESLRAKMRETHKNLLFDPDALSPEEHALILQEILADPKLREQIVNALQFKERHKIEEKTKLRDAIKKEMQGE